METMHVAIADDHPIFRSGLKFLLETSFKNIVIDQFENGDELLEFVSLHWALTDQPHDNPAEVFFAIVHLQLFPASAGPCRY